VAPVWGGVLSGGFLGPGPKGGRSAEDPRRKKRNKHEPAPLTRRLAKANRVEASEGLFAALICLWMVSCKRLRHVLFVVPQFPKPDISLQHIFVRPDQHLVRIYSVETKELE